MEYHRIVLSCNNNGILSSLAADWIRRSVPLGEACLKTFAHIISTDFIQFE